MAVWCVLRGAQASGTAASLFTRPSCVWCSFPCTSLLPLRGSVHTSISHARHTFWCGAWRRWQCTVHHARARRAFLRRSGPWRK